MSGRQGREADRLRRELEQLRRRETELESSAAIYRRLAEELRHGEDLFRSMADNANDAIMVLDEQGTVIYINRAGETLFGQGEREIIGKRMHETLIPERFRDYSIESFAARGAAGMQEMVGTVREFQALRKDGTEFPVEVSISAVQSGERTFYVTFCRDISSRKHAEEELEGYRAQLEILVDERTRKLREVAEELRRSERYYFSLIRNAVDMIIVLNEDLTLRWGSPSANVITGYIADDIYGKNILDFIHPDDLQEAREAVDRILADPAVQSRVMLRFRHKDGSWHYHEAVESNRLEDPAVRGIVVNSRDVSDRVSLHNELSRSERYFRAMIENAYDIVAVLDRSGNIGYLSPSLQRISGFMQEEMLGKDVFRFLHPDDISRIAELFATGLQPYNHTDIMEFRWQHKDGSWRWQEAVATNLLDDPAVRGIIVNARDITDRKLAEKSLRDSEEMYRTLMLIAPDAISVADLAGNFVYLSPKTLRLHGYDHPSELLGTSSLDLIAPEEREKAVVTLAAVISEGYVQTVQGIFLRKDGSRFVGELNAALIRDADGNPSGVVAYTRDITERRLADNALRESEERYRTLVETSPDAIVLSTLDGIVLMINRSGLDLFGYSGIDELPGMNVFAFIAPDDRQKALESMRSKSLAGKVVSAEYMLFRRGGESFLGEITATLVRDAEGNPAGFIAITRDITDRRRTEQALRVSEMRYRSMIETSPDCIIMVDLEGRITMVNRSGLNLFRCRDENEMVGRSASDFTMIEEWPRAKELMQLGVEVLTEPVEFISVRADGTRFLSECNARMLRNADGEPIGFLSITRDITERRRAEERLQKLNECFLSLGPDPLENIRLLALTGKDILAAEMVRYGRMEKGDFYVFSSLQAGDGFVHIEEVEDYLCFKLLSRGATGPVTTGDVDESILADDPDVQRYGFASFLFHPISVQGESVGCFNMLYEDAKTFSQIEVDTMAMLARAISIEEERYAFNESLRDFVDIASHELRHPVAILSGFTETLEAHGSEMDEATRTEVIDAIKHATERISRMVIGLMNVSLVEREHFQISKSTGDIAALTAQVLNEMSVKARGWEFDLVPAEGVVECAVDPERFHNLLVILLDNAVKYSPEGSAVRVVLERSETEVTVSVLDRGIGVPSEHRNKLFNRFYQVEEAQYHSTPGLGLGLFLARQIVEGHGGRIWYEPREGGGSIFRFTLPLT